MIAVPAQLEAAFVRVGVVSITSSTLEILHSYQQPTIVCFMDFAAAFDSVDRRALWRIMEEDGIPPKLLRLIKAYYSSTRTRVRAAGQETTSFEVQSGVRQGDNMSPALFNYAIDFVLERALLSSQGVQVGGNLYLTDLTCADTSPSSMTAPKQFKMLSTTSTILPNWWGYRSTHQRPRLCERSHAPGHNTPSTLVACPWRRLSPLNTWALPSRQLVRLRTKSAEGLALRAVPLSA